MPTAVAQLWVTFFRGATVAHQRFIGDQRVLHTRKLTAVLIEVTLQNTVPGMPRQKTVLKLDEYERKVRQIPVDDTETTTCQTDPRKRSQLCLG